MEDYESENEIPHAESIDKMSVQLSLVLLVYAFVFLLMYGVEQLDMGIFGEKTVKPLFWGFIGSGSGICGDYFPSDLAEYDFFA